MAKFVCKESYRQFYGYVFVNGKPVEVSDRYTLDRIRREPSFTEIKEAHDAMQGQRQAQKEVKRRTLHLPKRQP